VDVADQNTYLPGRGDLSSIRDFLTSHATGMAPTANPTYSLTGPDGLDRVGVPREIHEILRQVVEALSAGRAVAVSSISTRLTTQQAAELLMISRPTLVKLLDAGAIPCERVSSRRSVRLSDVLAYRESRRAAQLLTLDNSGRSDAHKDDSEKLT
jgi:excisionase family DNA binding protein